MEMVIGEHLVFDLDCNSGARVSTTTSPNPTESTPAPSCEALTLWWYVAFVETASLPAVVTADYVAGNAEPLSDLWQLDKCWDEKTYFCGCAGDVIQQSYKDTGCEEPESETVFTNMAADVSVPFGYPEGGAQALYAYWECRLDA